MRKVKGNAILRYGPFNSKLLYIENLNAPWRALNLSKIPTSFTIANSVDIKDNIKEYIYLPSNKFDKYGRKIFLYENRRIRTGGNLPEYQNNQKVVELQYKFERLKNELTNSSDMVDSVREMIVTEYNETLRELTKLRGI